MSKIQKRIVEYRNNVETISFILEDGKKISNSAAINAVNSGKIYNAKIIVKNGLQKVIAKNGFIIPTQKIFSNGVKNKSASNIVLEPGYLQTRWKELLQMQFCIPWLKVPD